MTINSPNEDAAKIRRNLSHRQRRELEKLAKDPEGRGYYGSCTNSTMGALKRRGLVDILWSEIPGSPYRSERWIITEAGKSVSGVNP